MKDSLTPLLLIVLLWGAGDGQGPRAARADWRIDENVLAHRLYADGRPGDAAEIFTDPAWKGVALYRSEQWWRAAEAFVRADDPTSAYNLGNCYVKLGYHALALEAYNRALAGDPTLIDARHNAELMRELLASDEDATERGGRTDPDGEIDRLENDDPDDTPGGGAGGDEDAEPGAGDENDTGAPAKAPTPGEASGDGSSGGAGDREPDAAEGEEASDPIDGETAEPDGSERAGGASETDTAGEAADATGLRATLESEQATEQWLNRIRQDPARYLAKRIALEVRRRSAAGQAPPAGGDGW